MDKVIFEKDKVILKNELYFDVETTLDCGQAFRFIKGEDGKMFGIVGDRTIKVYRENNDVILEGTNETEFNAFWRNYFDLDFDYIALIDEFKDDEAITLGAKEAYGLRVLNQPKFETIISFIISANNNIKRIKGIIERICQQFGTEIEDGIFAFPTVEQLSKATKEDFLALGAGYRADYLYTATHQILQGFDLDGITDMPYKQAKKEIQKLKGVGPKVADCVLLFSCKIHTFSDYCR